MIPELYSNVMSKRQGGDASRTAVKSEMKLRRLFWCLHQGPWHSTPTLRSLQDTRLSSPKSDRQSRLDRPKPLKPSKTPHKFATEVVVGDYVPQEVPQMPWKRKWIRV